jgi:hypothetical protein
MVEESGDFVICITEETDIRPLDDHLELKGERGGV